MSQLSPLSRNPKILFSLVQPIPMKTILQVDRRRFPHSGPQVANAHTVELQEIKNALTLTTKEFARELSAFDEIETSPETLQAYLQGYIASPKLIDLMLVRARAFVAAQPNQVKRFSGMSMIAIMDSWLDKLDIDPLSTACPWRKISKIVDKDHSVLFRWYQGNRKPRSIDTIVAIDNAISSFVQAHPRRS